MKRRSLVGITGVLLSLIFVLQEVGAAGGGDTRVVFLSNRDRLERPGREFDIFLLDLASSKSENLTLQLKAVVVRSNSQPRLITRRNSVVFLSFNERALIELNLGTKQVTKITDVAYEATSYTVSPDGNTLLYIERGDSTRQVFEVDLASGVSRNVTRNCYNNFEASYSPDGKRIVYICDKDGSNSIAVMNRDGSEQTILTNRFGDDRYPHWSPDGKKIVFSSSRSGATDAEYHLYTIDANGKNFKLFYQSKAYNSSPVFSPDNKYVAFVSNGRGGMHKDIILKELGSGLVKPITFELNDANGKFAIGDGGKVIVFENSGPIDSEIMLYDVRLKKMKNLTSGKGRDLAPSLGEGHQVSQ